ncbi:MAG: NTP transferase domain-containing protein [Spirochaetaceae bacterium]
MWWCATLLPVSSGPASAYDCILLAAGPSTRMRRAKQLEPVCGTPLFLYALRTALQSCFRVVVVEGAVPLSPYLPVDDRVVVVRNEHYRRGQLGSLQVGLRERRTPGAFIMLADLPLVKPPTYDLIAEAVQPTGPAAAAYPAHAGRRGHPVWIGAAAVELLLSAPPDRRAMEVIATVGPREVEVEDEGIYLDADTPEALAALAERVRRRD